ncbi:MAG: hypothetical protein ABJC63_14750 [Gemmatimonadales bacterium]
MPNSIRTIAHRADFTPDSLHEEHDGPIVACDFYVVGAESGNEVPGGYQIETVLNVDHHAPTPRMTRCVSSTNLADHVKALGLTSRDSLVIVSHTDCDSVLSSCIMAGELEPDAQFGEAAIAADHSGETNEIADVCNHSTRCGTSTSPYEIFASCWTASDSTRWDAKMRLGQSAPAGASLHSLRTERLDSAFAGRWNTGSNARNGGTTLHPEVYASRVTDAMRESWGV